jgi:hypothetical protein
MTVEYEILETWNTSLGLIASIRFTSKEIPKIGRKILYQENDYSITGFQSHSYPHEANFKLVELMKQGIYNCLLKPVNEI